MGPFESQEMNDYFEKLPGVVQQAILQSGLAPKTMAQLSAAAENLESAQPKDSAEQ